MKKSIKETTTFVVNDDKSKKDAELTIKNNPTMNAIEKQQAISSLKTAKKGDKIITKEEKEMEFKDQYEKLISLFKSKGWQTSIDKLEPIKNDPVKLLKVYNAYFRNPIYDLKHGGSGNLNESKIRKFISKQLILLLKEAGFDMPDLGSESNSTSSLLSEKEILLQKFPQLREALVSVMGVDFNKFIEDIKYVAPKPSTFKVVMNGDESFNLFWTGAKIGWVAEVAAKKYHLIYQNETQQAIKAINRLLRIGSSSEDETAKNPVSNPVTKDDFKADTVSEPSPTEEPLKENINIQDRADAINHFAKIVKNETDENVLAQLEAIRDYPTEYDITFSEAKKILKKYNKENVLSLLDKDNTDPAGGSGLNSHV